MILSSTFPSRYQNSNCLLEDITSKITLERDFSNILRFKAYKYGKIVYLSGYIYTSANAHQKLIANIADEILPIYYTETFLHDCGGNNIHVIVDANTKTIKTSDAVSNDVTLKDLVINIMWIVR